MIYSITVFNESDERVAVLTNTGAPTYSRSKNTADQVFFQIPRNDPNISLETFDGASFTSDTIDVSVDSAVYTADTISLATMQALFQPGRRFEINRISGPTTTYLECSGFVSANGYDGEYYTVEGFTEEILLTQMLTPAQYGYVLYSENANIGDLAEELSKAYVVEEIKWDWDDYIVASTNIDTTTNPTFVILQSTGTDPETGVPTYPASGSVTFRFQKDADQTWERFRWVSDYYEDDEGNEVTTKVSYRQANTIGGLGAFTTPQAGTLTDIVGIILADPDAVYTEIKVDFATTESTTSPVLFALEVIKREPGTISSVTVTGDTSSLVTPGLSADNEPFFDVLSAALEPHGWEFQVVDYALEVKETFGVSRTNDFSVVAG